MNLCRMMISSRNYPMQHFVTTELQDVLNCNHEASQISSRRRKCMTIREPQSLRLNLHLTEFPAENPIEEEERQEKASPCLL